MTPYIPLPNPSCNSRASLLSLTEHKSIRRLLTPPTAAEKLLMEKLLPNLGVLNPTLSNQACDHYTYEDTGGQEDSQDLLIFPPMEARLVQNEVGEEQSRLLNLKRPNDGKHYSFVKRPLKGAKIIRIDIYDAKDFADHEESLCKCKADLCVQHVVKHTMMDGIYQSTKDLIVRIQENVENVF